MHSVTNWFLKLKLCRFDFNFCLMSTSLNSQKSYSVINGYSGVVRYVTKCIRVFFFFCKTTLILRAKRTVNYRTPEFRTVFIDKNDRTESGFAQTVRTRMHNNNILNTTGHLHARFFLYGHPQFGIITSII